MYAMPVRPPSTRVRCVRTHGVCTVCRVHTLHTYMDSACMCTAWVYLCVCTCPLSAYALHPDCAHRRYTAGARAHTVSACSAPCVYVLTASVDAVCYLHTQSTHSMPRTGVVSVHCADRWTYACVFVRTLYASCHTWMDDVCPLDVHRAHTVCIFYMQCVDGAWISCVVLSHALYVRTPCACAYMCVHHVPPRVCVLWMLCALTAAPCCACAGSVGCSPASCMGPMSRACPQSAVLRLKSYII